MSRSPPAGPERTLLSCMLLRLPPERNAASKNAGNGRRATLGWCRATTDDSTPERRRTVLSYLKGVGVSTVSGQTGVTELTVSHSVPRSYLLPIPVLHFIILSLIHLLFFCACASTKENLDDPVNVDNVAETRPILRSFASIRPPSFAQYHHW